MNSFIFPLWWPSTKNIMDNAPKTVQFIIIRALCWDELENINWFVNCHFSPVRRTFIRAPLWIHSVHRLGLNLTRKTLFYADIHLKLEGTALCFHVQMALLHIRRDCRRVLNYWGICGERSGFMTCNYQVWFIKIKRELIRINWFSSARADGETVPKEPRKCLYTRGLPRNKILVRRSFSLVSWGGGISSLLGLFRG